MALLNCQTDGLLDFPFVYFLSLLSVYLSLLSILTVMGVVLKCVITHMMVFDKTRLVLLNLTNLRGSNWKV